MPAVPALVTLVNGTPSDADDVMQNFNALRDTINNYGTFIDVAQTFSAPQTFAHASGLLTNTIGERTAAAGVTIDGVLLKDGGATLTGLLTVANNGIQIGATANRGFSYESGSGYFWSRLGVGDLGFRWVSTAGGVIATLADSGAITGGTYNGQTISSAASFTGSVTIATTLAVTGVSTFSDQINVTRINFPAAVAHVANTIYRSATGGLVIGLQTGSSNDFQLLTPGTSSDIMWVPTGTRNVFFGLGINVASSLTVAGATSLAAVTISTTLAVTGAVTLNSTLGVTGVLTATTDIIAGTMVRKSANNSVLDLAGSTTNTVTGGALVRVWGNTGANPGRLELNAGNTSGAYVSILIGASVEVGRFDDVATAEATRLMVYDITGASLKRVSRGAADSGGVGFRLLRIPN